MFSFRKIKILILILLLTPSFALANQNCSKDGYTVLTMNGIFNNEERAKNNKRELERKLFTTLNGQPVIVDLVHNQSHLAGLGDVLKAAYQGLLDDETIQDYDLTQMIKTASEKITTQKVLIVAHSQGNFYANSFYDVVAGQEGGIPKESLGVYAVATPSGRTSGGGLWLTSTTDKVIAGTVGTTLRRKIMPPNTTIDLSNEGDSNGHGFTEIYLKYRAERIVGDIEKSLNLLRENNIQAENEPCMNPPKISLSHRVTGILFSVADPVANTSVKVLSSGYSLSNKILETGGTLVQKSLLEASSFVLNTSKLLANSLGSFFASNKNNNSVVIKTSDSTEENFINEVKDTRVVNQVLNNQVVTDEEKVEEKSIVSETKQETFQKEIPDIIEIVPIIPKQGPGGGVKTVTPQNNVNAGNIEITTNLEIQIEPCTLFVSDNTCLLTTTTVGVSWTAIPSATHYNFVINGVQSSTTATSISLELEDFSDYNFELVPVGSNSENLLATSTKSFVVASIPVAINEIAFWGTWASENDEWLELKNNTNYSIDLSSWALRINNGETNMPLAGVLGPKEYLLVMRGDSAVVVDNGAMILGWDEEIQNIFSDTGEKVFLYYLDNYLDSTPDWKEEDDTGLYNFGDKETIERKKSRLSGEDFSNWGYNLYFIKNGDDAVGDFVSATPGEHNSVSYLINGGETIITEDLTLDSENGPYAVFDTIVVTASSTLRIEEGTQIYFIDDGDGIYGNFYVPGRVVAGGDGEQAIFVGEGENPEGFFWFNSDQATSTFNNVLFENTETIGLINNSKVEIKNSSFINNGSGINAYNGASLSLDNVTIASTTGEAVAGYNNTYLTVASSTIADTYGSDGISVYNDSFINIENTVVTNSGYDGISVYSSIANISSTTVNGSENNAMALYTSTTTIDQITLEDSEESSLFVVGGVVDISNSTLHDSQNGYALEVISQSNNPPADVAISDSFVVGDTEDVYETHVGSIVLDDLIFCDAEECLAN